MRHQFFVVGAALTWATLVAGQAPPAQDAGRVDTPAIRQRLDTLRKSAGSEWAETFEFFCAMNPNRANRADDPEIEPTRVFDNLAVIGRTSTAVWVVTTSSGLVMIDAGYGDQLDSLLLAGMKKLGLDPARVTHVIVAHGHGDHFGGASYFQQRGARVVMGAPDWDLVEAPPAAGRGPAPAAAPIAPPRRDIAVTDGQTLTVGDVTFTFVMIPGHTPGSVGIVFSVKDGTATRMAGLFGGSILIPTRIPDEGLRQYMKSIEHWGNVTRKMNVEVEIQNHPMYDGFLAKLQRLKQRKAPEPNPFVIGREGYRRFLDVMSGCTDVQLARRTAA
ncbi:MAG TPA: MBL fold metallo-hydrolase [Vicinamibacterales bacterium]|nr:MBL fold metallo-hydrolase [Vicinamibacterales bacterium]